MENEPILEFPALIYKIKNNYIADNLMFNISAIGKSKKEAIKNLKTSLNKEVEDFIIEIKPLYETKKSF